MTTPLAYRLPDFPIDDEARAEAEPVARRASQPPAARMRLSAAKFKPVNLSRPDMSASGASRPGVLQPLPAGDEAAAAAPGGASFSGLHAETGEMPPRGDSGGAGDTGKTELRTVTPLAERQPRLDLDALLKEHGDKVRREEARKAEEALARALESERNAHAAALAEARGRWVREEAAAMADRVASALADIEDRLSGAVARIFTPFLKEAVREKAIGALRDAVVAILADGAHGRLEISGPEDLVEAVREAIAPYTTEGGSAIDYRVADAADVRVIAGHAICTTQIAAWNDLIEIALHGGSSHHQSDGA